MPGQLLCLASELVEPIPSDSCRAAAKVGLDDGSAVQGLRYDVDGALRLLEDGLPL